MEYRFLLCDDLEEHLNILEKYLNNCLREREISYRCDKTASGSEALEMYIKDRHHIVFLDIDMPGSSGIQIAEKIFDINNDAVIIYVTAYPEYAEKAYEQFVFQYITKPIDKYRLGIVIDKALEEIQKNLLYNNTTNFFIINKNSEHIKIMNEDVLFFEKISNYVSICMKNGQNINARMTFKELEKIIDMKFYLRCHNGFIVNKLKIASMSAKVIKIDGINKTIPIGRSYRKSILKEWYKYINSNFIQFPT